MAEKQEDKKAKAVEQSTALVTLEEAPPEVKVEALEDFVQLMKADLDLRTKELGIREKEIDNAHDYSKGALQAQVEDRKESRIERRISRRDYLLAAGGVFVLLVAFLCICIYTGNGELAKQIIYFGGTALVSGVSGYFLGKTRADQRSNDSESE